MSYLFFLGSFWGKGGGEGWLVFFGGNIYDMLETVYIESLKILLVYVFLDIYTLVLWFINLIVCFIVLYAFYYMFFDGTLIRFFVIVFLFVYFMCFFLISSDFLTAYINWECIGLFSFFLISFFWYRHYALKAGFKAFSFAKIGDCLLLLSFVILLKTVGVPIIIFLHVVFFFDINNVFYGALFLLLCSFSKSTQFGLHVWLPDAMEGPIPVSALIHAATLVVAGIILSSYIYQVFQFWITYLYIICIISSLILTFIVISIVGNFDIKRYIAFSTILQISLSFYTVLLVDIILGILFFCYHMFYKATLFIIIGIWVHVYFGMQDIRIFYFNILFSHLSIKILFIFSIFNSCSLWFVSGFYLKETILNYILIFTWKYIFLEYLNLLVFIIMFTIFYNYFIIVYLTFIFNNITINTYLHNTFDFEITIITCACCILLVYFALFFFIESLIFLYNFDVLHFYLLITNETDIGLIIVLLLLLSTLYMSSKFHIFLILFDICYFTYKVIYILLLILIILIVKIMLDQIFFFYMFSFFINKLTLSINTFVRYNYMMFLLFCFM